MNSRNDALGTTRPGVGLDSCRRAAGRLIEAGGLARLATLAWRIA